jgi:hypothetical protein
MGLEIGISRPILYGGCFIVLYGECFIGVLLLSILITVFCALPFGVFGVFILAVGFDNFRVIALGYGGVLVFVIAGGLDFVSAVFID